MAAAKSSSGHGDGRSPSELIDARIEELGDWRGDTLVRIRKLIRQADPDVVEEWKWRGVPVWYHHGMICTGETYKDKVKLTFARGASLQDHARREGIQDARSRRRQAERVLSRAPFELFQSTPAQVTDNAHYVN